MFFEDQDTKITAKNYLEESTDIAVSSQTLDDKNQKLVRKIVEEEDSREIKDLLQQFNLNHTKKQVVRSAIFDQLLDQITDQMQERLIKRGDQFSNKDLLDYMNTINASVDKTQKQMQEVDAIPVIQVNQQTNNIVVGPQLDRESRERVTSAIEMLMKRLEENKLESVEIPEATIVYNNDEDENLSDSSSSGINNNGGIGEEDNSLDDLFNSDVEDDNL